MTDQCHSFRTGGKREARWPKPSPLAEPAAGVKQESTHSQLEAVKAAGLIGRAYMPSSNLAFLKFVGQ